MHTYSLFHLSDQALASGLASAVARDRAATATLLAHIAEFDARRLYAPAGYSSMHGYCVSVLGLSEDAAYKRITAARAARDHRAIFDMVADGRLHLTAVVRLAPHLCLLTGEQVAGLLATAARRSKSEIEGLLAERFPRPDLTAAVRALPTRSAAELVPEPVGTPGTAGFLAPTGAAGAASAVEPAGKPETELVPEPVGTPEVAQNQGTNAAPKLPAGELVRGSRFVPRSATGSSSRWGRPRTNSCATWKT